MMMQTVNASSLNIAFSLEAVVKKNKCGACS